MIKGNILKRVSVLRKVKQINEEDYIITQAKKGDDKAFEKLIDIYEDYLYKMAFLYTKNEHDAGDIYQDTVLKAYLSLSKLKDNNSFKTWITRILINNVYTKNRHISKFEDENPEDFIGDYSYTSIEENLDLYEAIDILEEKYRTPIILQYFYDLTIIQISEITNYNENTVKTNIRRGKQKMYESLKEGNNE